MTTKIVTAFITNLNGRVYGYAVSTNPGKYLHHIREEGEPTDAAAIIETLKGIPLPNEVITKLAEKDEAALKERHGKGLTLEEIGTYEAEIE